MLRMTERDLTWWWVEINKNSLWSLTTPDSDPVTLVESDVVKCLSCVNQKKALGLDGLPGSVLKVCANQLGLFLLAFFSGSWIFILCQVPGKCLLLCWSIKKAGTWQLNNFRPVALTSVIAKYMERLVCNQLITSVADRRNPYSSCIEPEGV